MGMLFDHGCDAFVAMFNSFLLMRMFNIGSSKYQLFLIQIALFPFYFVTMEQYYTGEMNFPPINGVDEGSIVITGLSILSAYVGNVELWSSEYNIPFVGKMILNDVLKRVVVVSVYAYGFSGLYQIYNNRHKPHFKAVYVPQYFVAQIFFYFFNLYTMTMMQVYSLSDIWRTHTRTVSLLFGFQIIYVVLRMQFSHIIHA
jgi:hypothetical protein